MHSDESGMVRMISSLSPAASGQLRHSWRDKASAGSGLSPVVVLYLIAVFVPISIDVGTLVLSGLRLVLLIMFVPLLYWLFSGRAGRLLPADFLFLAHSAWICIALAVNNPLLFVENSGSTVAEFLGGYLIARIYIRKAQDFIRVCKILFVMILITIPFALKESNDGIALIPSLIDKFPPFSSVADVSTPQRMGLERSQVVFAHPIHYGLFCSVGMTLALIGLRGVLLHITRYLVAILIGLGVFLSLSSGALLAMLMQLCLVAWAFVFRNVKNRWIILLLMTALVYVAVDLGSNRTPLRVFFTYATFSSHNAYWRGIIFEWGMINVWANPIFGLGLRDWVRPFYMYSGSMDNFWLVMAVRYGIPGFLLIALGYADILFRVMLKKVDDPLVAQLRLAWVITFVGLSFTLSTVHIWTAIYSFVFFLLGCGAWIANSEHNAARSADRDSLVQARLPRHFSRFPPIEDDKSATDSSDEESQSVPTESARADSRDGRRDNLRHTRFEDKRGRHR